MSRSKWFIYDEQIKKLFGTGLSWTEIARKILENNDIEYDDKEVDLLRTYARRLHRKYGKEVYDLGDTSTPNYLSSKRTPGINDQVGMHIVLGCMHVPFHNQSLLEGILKLIDHYENEIVGFHLIGDFLDLNTLSSHDRGKFPAIRDLTLNDEYDAGNDVLTLFDKALPSYTWKTYVYGNHEDRYNRFMADMNNAKTPLASPEEALSLEHRGYQVKTDWKQDYFRLGNHLDIFHGIYYNVHSAKKHLDVFRGSCLYAHTHRIQTYIEGDMGSFNIGFLGDKEAPAFNYATRAMKSQWQNGFAIVNISEDGRYNVQQIVCDNDHFYFGSQKY